MLRLVAPSRAHERSWSAAHREWGPGLHEDGFGLAADDEVESAEGFDRFVTRVRQSPAARLWWVLEDDEVVGGVALRTDGAPDVLRRGHIGYGLRPSARGRGVGTWLLGEVLRRAPEAGLRRVLLVCLEDNVPSVRTIERHGGVLEGVVDDGGVRVRRYWIELSGHGHAPVRGPGVPP